MNIPLSFSAPIPAEAGSLSDSDFASLAAAKNFVDNLNRTHPAQLCTFSFDSAKKTLTIQMP